MWDKVRLGPWRWHKANVHLLQTKWEQKAGGDQRVTTLKQTKWTKLLTVDSKIIQLHSIVVLSWRQRGKNILNFYLLTWAQTQKSTHVDWVGILTLSHRLSWNHRFLPVVWSWAAVSGQGEARAGGSGCCSTIFRKMSPTCLQGLEGVGYSATSSGSNQVQRQMLLAILPIGCWRCVPLELMVLTFALLLLCAVRLLQLKST